MIRTVFFMKMKEVDAMKRLLGILIVCALAVSLIVPERAAAANNSVWVKEAGKEAWTYTDGQGTNLVAKIQEDTLYIQGEGAVPSYDRDCLGNRPWHNKAVKALVIEKGITSIGAEAFSNMKYVQHVTMWASTFIESPTAFGGAEEECLFDIMGTNIASRNIGNVPYNSLDSIAAFMERFNGYYRFSLANYYMINWVQNSAYPKVENVSPQDALTTYSNPKYPLLNYQNSLDFVSPKPDKDMSLNIRNRRQGTAALEAFSIMLGDATYVTAYNISVSGKNGAMTHTDTPLTYVMTIPTALQYPGRQFSLLQIGNGVVNVLADEDWNDATLTFTTDYPSTVYALIYR